MIVSRSGTGSREKGFALVAVVMSIAVLSLFLLAALAYALNDMRPARRDQDAKSAEQAALAGVDEYISRLNANDNYWKVGNVDAANAAFSTAGQVIQGTGATSTAARYRYTVLSSAADTTSQGVIRLQVVGMSGPANNTGTVTRTVTAELRRKGVLNFIYLSDVEATDPGLLNLSSSCGNYYYAVGSTVARPSSCTNTIHWNTGDVVNGPLHSNDALPINGTVNFTSPQTETSWPAASGLSTTAKTWVGNQGYPLPGNEPVYAASIDLPASNNDLLKNVEPDVDGDGSVGPGCYYTGATRIIFQGTTMRVLSPSTTTSDTPSRCYNTSTPATEQTVAVPPVVYVDSSTASCTIGTIGYPAANEAYTPGATTAIAWTASGSNSIPNYACTRGTVFVSGTSATPVTVAGSDDVVVTGDLKPDATNGVDVIGLVAGGFVWVYHPLKNGTSNNLLGSTAVTTIQAAILALRHSFIVQSAKAGTPLGTLNVYGAIAQKFRGQVATVSGTTVLSGYDKNYNYDSRLAYTQPPFFLKASNSPFLLSKIIDD
jgi:type II secretory pathway pseudopilin PulG